MRLPTVKTMIDGPIPSFSEHFQNYVCSVQDRTLDFEISSVYATFKHQSELYQIKQIQKILKINPKEYEEYGYHTKRIH